MWVVLGFAPITGVAQTPSLPSEVPAGEPAAGKAQSEAKAEPVGPVGESAPAPHLQKAREPVPLDTAPSAGATGAALPPAEAPPPETQPESPPETATKEAAETPAASEEPGRPAFIKGELIHPGTRRLLSRFDHIGVSVGPNIIERDLLIGVAPGMAWYMENGLSFSLHLPIRLLAVEGGSLDFGGLKIRREDWDEIADYAKVIRFVTFGRKESNIYFTVNTMRPATIGHGLVLNKYQGDIDVDRSLTGIVFDAYNRYGGFELQANDITFTNRVVGGLLFVKPLSFFSDSVYAEGVSIGVESVADLRAPTCVRFGADSAECVQGSGHAAGFDPFTGASLDQTFVRTDPDTGRFAVDEDRVQAIGLSAEAKVYKDERNIDLKLYGTYHRFINDGGGDGIAAGLLARLNFGASWLSAFRLRGEYRTFVNGFLPGYFDSLYEIHKYAYQFRSDDYQVTPTKYQAVFGDPANGFVRPEHGRRHGYNIEAAFGGFHESRSKKQIAFGFGLQDSTGPDDTTLYVHAEVPWFGWLQVFATYLRTNVDGVGKLVTANAFNAQNAILLSGMRLQILPILFVNAHYARSFRVVATPGSEYHLGNDTIVDRNGEPSTYFRSDRLFENVQTLFVEVELGWEFGDE
jgi:hypothetical protein